VTNTLHFDNTTDVIIGVDHTETLGQETYMLRELGFLIEPEDGNVRRLHILDLDRQEKLIHDLCHGTIGLSAISLFMISVVKTKLFADKNKQSAAVQTQVAAAPVPVGHPFSGKRTSVLDDRFLGPKKLKTRFRHPES
jgi:hypothetical protein